MPTVRLPVVDNSDALELDFRSLSEFVSPVYMDNNATTQVDSDAISAMIGVMENEFANPSSIHAGGTKARGLIEEARSNAAMFIGCLPKEVIFTSGATESINSAISSAVTTQYPRTHFVSCLTEHGATLNKLKEVESKTGYKVSYLDVDGVGRFSTQQLKELLGREPQRTNLVCLLAVNNETGTIHDNIFEAIELAHQYGALFHIDAVQAAGKMPLKPYIDAGVDFLSLSGHKFHAPKGIGALFVKKSIQFAPSILGGYQEDSKRAGTENVPGIVALGTVCKKYVADGLADMTGVHKKFVKQLSGKIPLCIMNGGGVSGTVNVGFKYVSREAMVVKMSQYGLYAGVGSSCASGIEPSHVLKAMKVPKEYIHGSVRFSCSKYTTEAEVDRAVDIIAKAYDEVRSMGIGIVE